MKRAPIIEDWSRFNRAVLEVADSQLVGRKQPVPQQPKPPEFVPEPVDGGDSYGLITRHQWRKHA
jgi:hypothetical protein